jgi:hypothetical protein
MWEIGQNLFFPVLFIKFHHRTNLIALFFRTFVEKITKKSELEILSPRGTTSHTNSDLQWGEFHHRTNGTIVE